MDKRHLLLQEGEASEAQVSTQPSWSRVTWLILEAVSVVHCPFFVVPWLKAIRWTLAWSVWYNGRC